MQIVIGILVVVLASCGQLELTEQQLTICTISDCSEGVTLAQMRATTQRAAYDAGADTIDRLMCMRANANVRCYVWWRLPISGEYTLVCTWTDCDEHDQCDTFSGCARQ